MALAFVAVAGVVVVLRGPDPGPVGQTSPDTLSAAPVAVAADKPANIDGRQAAGRQDSQDVEGAALQPVAPLNDRSVDGAISAVMFFLELSEEVVHLSPEEGAAVQRRYATAASADSSAAEVSAQLEELGSASGPGMRLDVAAINWRVTEIEPNDEYAVSVWYVEIFSLGDPADAFGSFKTYSAAVRWESGGWKLHDATVFDGPQPVMPQGAVTGAELRAVLSGFGDGGRLLPLLLAGNGDGSP